MTTDTENSMFQTWEFKGIEIKPLSYARKFKASKLVDFSKVTPWDMAVLTFALVCDELTLSKGTRDPSWFDEKVSEWINKNKITMEDFNESAMATIKSVMENSDANKAIPITDPSMMPDPLGNG